MRELQMLLLISVAAAAGCDRANDDADQIAADSARVAEDATAVASLLGPIRAVSRAEVEFGEMAAQRSQSDVIRQYGQTIAADHRAVLATLDSMAQSRGTSLPETGPALEMANVVRMAHAGLDNLVGPDFDLPFIRAEVESHRQLIDRLDQQVIPAATSEEMRNTLTDIRIMADAHLTRARQLLAQQLGESADPPPVQQPQVQPPRPQPPVPPQPTPPPDTIGVLP